MSRTSDNPYKHSGTVPARPDVTLGVITHYTGEPYHKDRFDVVDLCIRSMMRGYAPTNGGDSPLTQLLIWDNGSAPEFVDWLRDHFRAYVYTSTNVGVNSARKGIFALARGKCVACTDDDVFFYPGWFEAEMEVLKTYPNVGVVGGSPIRTMGRWACSSALRFASENKCGTVGKLIPDEYERDFCTSIGRDYEFHKNYTIPDTDLLLDYHGVKAWGHGHHMQFLAERDVIAPFCQESVSLMDSMRPFDNAIDNAGLLRLTTHKRVVRHIGNVVDDDIRAEAKRYGYL